MALNNLKSKMIPNLTAQWRRYFFSLVLAIVLRMAFPLSVHGQGKPNIILFLVDDMGWQDTSVQFHSVQTIWNVLYNTPNMQRLSDMGMKFVNAYAAAPVCSPTRASLLTGKSPMRTGITDWIGHGISTNRYLTSPNWNMNGLQPGDGNTTLPSILKAHGYLTALVGKAHFGAQGTAGADPVSLGFDINIGGSHVGSPQGMGM